MNKFKPDKLSKMCDFFAITEGSGTTPLVYLRATAAFLGIKQKIRE